MLKVRLNLSTSGKAEFQLVMVSKNKKSHPKKMIAQSECIMSSWIATPFCTICKIGMILRVCRAMVNSMISRSLQWFNKTILCLFKGNIKNWSNKSTKMIPNFYKCTFQVDGKMLSWKNRLNRKCRKNQKKQHISTKEF